MFKLQSTLVEDKWVKAGVPGPRQTLTGVDILHGHMAVPALLVYPQGLDVPRLEQGLREALRRYPVISGRFQKDAQGLPYLDGSDSGVQFRVLGCKGPTPVGELHPAMGGIRQFYTNVMPWQIVGKNVPTLQVSVHQFEDGGATLLVRIIHSQFDGSSLFGFMMDWSRACLGQPMVGQTFDRDQMIRIGQAQVPTQGLATLYKPSLPSFMGLMARLGWRALTDIRKEVFRIPASTVAQWQVQAKAEQPEGAVPNAARLASAFVLQAMSPLWPGQADRSMGMVLDMRYVKGLGLPRDYFGNALCYPEARVSEATLRSGSVTDAARALSPVREQITAEHVTREVALLEQARQRKEVPRLVLGAGARTLGPSLFQNNCSQLPVYEFDFGTGCPRWYETFPMTIRMLTLTPTPDKDGGVDLHLCATRAELRAVKQRLAAQGIAPHPCQIARPA
jgi:shikimate O-hydroxycinnamoyltransferase